MNAPAHEPLDELEFDRLQSFLSGLPTGAMNVEELDGFFCGLQTAPERLTNEVWLPLIWGSDANEQASFDSPAQAQAILQLVMRHWTTVGRGLARVLAEPDQLYLPILLDDGEGGLQGNDWARGYVRAMRLAPEGWEMLLQDPAQAGALEPLLWLAHEHDEDEQKRSPALPAEERQELLMHLVVGLNRAHASLEPQRQQRAQAQRQATTFRRTGVKPGRNDSCPCGSGRKYKHCCALAQRED